MLPDRGNDGNNREIQKTHERPVWLGSDTLCLSAKIDFHEGEGRQVTPIHNRRGKRPHVPRGAYAPSSSSSLRRDCSRGPRL